MKKPIRRSPEVEREVLQAVAEGATWRDLDQRDDLPAARTVRNWTEADLEFARAFSFAKRVKAAGLAAEGLARLDALDLAKIDPKLASAAVNLAGKKADYYRWLAGVTAPEDFGDRVRHEVADGATPTTTLFRSLVRPRTATAQVVEPERLEEGDSDE